MEWLNLLLDYAIAVGLVENRQFARQKCADLRLLPSLLNGDNNKATTVSSPDWFLGALFLSANWNAKLTLLIADLIFANFINQKLTTISFWPRANFQMPFQDVIAQTVFPIVLKILKLFFL